MNGSTMRFKTKNKINELKTVAAGGDKPRPYDQMKKSGASILCVMDNAVSLFILFFQ